MALPALAAVADLEARIGDTITDTTRAETILVDASTLVRAHTRLTWVDELGDLIADIPDTVVAVVCAVARRAYDNPRGVVQDTSGPFTERYAEDAGQVLYLTDTERDLLDRLNPSYTSGVWSLPTTRTELETADVYLDVVGSEPIPHLPRGPW